MVHKILRFDTKCVFRSGLFHSKLLWCIIKPEKPQVVARTSKLLQVQQVTHYWPFASVFKLKAHCLKIDLASQQLMIKEFVCSVPRHVCHIPCRSINITLQ